MDYSNKSAGGYNFNPKYLNRDPLFPNNKPASIPEGISSIKNIGDRFSSLSSNPNSQKAKKVEAVPSLASTGVDVAKSAISSGVADAGSDAVEEGASSLKGNLGSAGISALEELPNVIQNFSDKAESKEEATGKVLSLAGSSAKIGSAFGPLGTGIGAGVGAIAGLIGNAGWERDKIKEDDKDLTKKLDDEVEERKRQYYLNSSAQSIQADRNLMLRSNGYSA